MVDLSAKGEPAAVAVVAGAGAASITASAVPTATVCPTGTRIRVNTPAIGAGTSVAALSGDGSGSRGLKCPADVSVTGYNDMPFAEHFAPPLTTLRIPLTEMGNQAALLLLRKMRDPKTVLPSVQLQPSLVVRGSTAPPSRSR